MKNLRNVTLKIAFLFYCLYNVLYRVVYTTVNTTLLIMSINKTFGASPMNINIIMSIVFILVAVLGTVYLIKGDN